MENWNIRRKGTTINPNSYNPHVTRLKLNLGFTDGRLSSLHYPYSHKEY